MKKQSITKSSPQLPYVVSASCQEFLMQALMNFSVR